MAIPKTQSAPRERGNLTADAARADAEFAGAVGRMVRLGRAKRGLSRRQLAQDSGTSERYLAQIEGGAEIGNRGGWIGQRGCRSQGGIQVLIPWRANLDDEFVAADGNLVANL